MVSIKTMAVLIGLFINVATCTISKAQSWDEWFRQKKTQIDYLTKQIAELQLYTGYLKQGYAISKNGLGTVRDWTNGEFILHSDYYNSLKTVNPELRNNPEAKAIIAYATAISDSFTQLDLKGLSDESRSYISRVKSKVLAECDADISELQLVMTSGKTEMTDDERLRRLNKVYEAIKDKYQFTCSFTSRVNVLLQQKSQEEQNIQTLKKYYGIN
jgi:cell fate (sporulation/competence/biofilm development) regulator YlbF (YheA/YmcA/DUF963 family)